MKQWSCRSGPWGPRGATSGWRVNLGIVLASLPLTGCLLLGDLSKAPPPTLIPEICNFDVVDAYRCEGYKSTYYVEGFCKGGGLYSVEGRLTWRAETGKVTEVYEVEPLPFPPPKFGAGEIHFTATCDAEPYQAGSQANCLEPQFNTTMTGLPTLVINEVNKATPISVGQFSQGDLAPFPVEQDCAPATPMPKRPKKRKPPKPNCEPERVPALLIAAPQDNAVFDATLVDSFELALEPVRERVAQVDIEWQRLVGGRFQSVDELPSLVAWASFPITIAVVEGRDGGGGATYRVRVKPHDEICERTWSLRTGFRTVHGDPKPRQR